MSSFGFGSSLKAVRRHPIMAAMFFVWICAVGSGVAILFRYSNSPGPLAAPPVQWPGGAIVKPDSRHATLVAFVHPQCPCSVATVGELAEIMAHGEGKVNAYVFFYAPRTESSEWVRSGLWRDAAAIPGVHVMEDRDGRESRRFGAFTSGQVLLYDTRAQLVFNGGITLTRGHFGSNDGVDAVVSLIRTGTAKSHLARVFGCSLRGEE